MLTITSKDKQNALLKFTITSNGDTDLMGWIGKSGFRNPQLYHLIFEDGHNTYSEVELTIEQLEDRLLRETLFAHVTVLIANCKDL